MTPGFLDALLFALLPAVSALAGGVAAAIRPPGPGARSTLQHFAAGAAFSAVALELLPELRRTDRILPVALGFALGAGAMLLIRWRTRQAEAGGAGRASPGGVVAGVGVDILIDGLLLGVGFAANERAGRLLTFALAVEMVSLGLATAASLTRAGQAKARIIGTVAGLSLLILPGAVAGVALLRRLPPGLLEAALAFGAAALLFLVTEELLVEAHEESREETPLATATFFLGFLLFLILGMLD